MFDFATCLQVQTGLAVFGDNRYTFMFYNSKVELALLKNATVFWFKNANSEWYSIYVYI